MFITKSIIAFLGFALLISCTLKYRITGNASDLSQFTKHEVCKDIKSSPPEVLLEFYRLYPGKKTWREFVNVITVLETGVQFMQYSIISNSDEKLLNHRTEYGQLFAKIKGEWKEEKIVSLVRENKKIAEGLVNLFFEGSTIPSTLNLRRTINFMT